MNEAVYIAASALKAFDTAIKVIANNVSNSLTDGFKKDVVITTDLAYQNIKTGGLPENANSSFNSSRIQIGNGSKISGIHKINIQGGLKDTNNPYNLAIIGAGYFPLISPTGTRLYTRNGNFKMDNERNLISNDGLQLANNIVIPADVGKENIYISEDGRITGTTSNGESIEIGQMILTTFPNEDGLEAIGGGLYLANDSSGEARDIIPGQEGTGKLKQRFIELSNVSLIEEVNSLIQTQRAYELASKVMLAAGKLPKETYDF